MLKTGFLIAMLITVCLTGLAQSSPIGTSSAASQATGARRDTIPFWTRVRDSIRALDNIPPDIQVQESESGDSLHFSARLRPLRQLAGAPAAYYTYFWELGDGRFSFDKTPTHIYKDTGTYQVRLYATNNYDDGKAPPTKPRPIKVRKPGQTKGGWASHFFHGNGDLELKVNRNPRPGEDFVALVGYRNQSADSLSGSIVLFYNERQFGQNAFSLTDKRYYHKEDSADLNNLMATIATHSDLATSANLSFSEAGATRENAPLPNFSNEARSMLHNLQATYTSNSTLHFNKVATGEEQFVFMDLNTLPGMIQDTNATVVITAMLVPDNPNQPPTLHQLELPVVASHDPNRIDITPRRINYRFMGKKKEISYRVQFQNTGKGPARKISIGIAIPRQLNTASVKLKTLSPVCTWCDSAYNSQSCIDTTRSGDSIYFTFKNVYLPGLQQQGVTDQDSTKGFVEYTIRFRKKPKKIPFNTAAAIVFDNNAPVYTNKATAKFIKGLSPGIMAGYVYSPSNGNYSTKGSLQLGYVLAPFAPSRPYFQVEAWAGLLQQDESTTGVIKDQKDTLIGIDKYLIVGRETKTILKKNSFEITPLHFRYNIKNWIGIGVGTQVMVNISEQTETQHKIYFTSTLLPNQVNSSMTVTRTRTTYLGTWNAAPFVDLQLGGVRQGPVVGLRYLRLLKRDVTNRFFLYAGFKL